jgi:hypothetical protein
MRILFLILVLFANTSYAKNEPADFLDIEVGFGSYILKLKYLYKNTRTPHEGYLLQPHDIAMLKVDLDSYKEDCEQMIHKASLSCMADLKQCAEDSEQRQNILSNENILLIKNLETAEQKIISQTQKIWLYSIASTVSATALTALYFVLK